MESEYIGGFAMFIIGLFLYESGLHTAGSCLAVFGAINMAWIAIMNGA